MWAQANVADFGSDLSMYFPRALPMDSGNRRSNNVMGDVAILPILELLMAHQFLGRNQDSIC